MKAKNHGHMHIVSCHVILESPVVTKINSEQYRFFTDIS